VTQPRTLELVPIAFSAAAAEFHRIVSDWHECEVTERGWHFSSLTQSKLNGDVLGTTGDDPNQVFAHSRPSLRNVVTMSAAAA
jgi:hypothetical protein